VKISRFLAQQQQSLLNRFTLSFFTPAFNYPCLKKLQKLRQQRKIRLMSPTLPVWQGLPSGDNASVEVAADLQSIMAMIDAMRAVDTDGVQPLSHPLDAAVRLRSDVVTESPDPQHFQRHAPATADQYYLVPRVVE
jgi:aspartyl-tRNA(Asn)/glutamyl-tRNA(Gln) amidotransferase subunit C